MSHPKIIICDITYRKTLLKINRTILLDHSFMSRVRNTLFAQECMTDIRINKNRFFIGFFFEMLNVTLSYILPICLYTTFA